ncbi:hypothetical protein GF367_03545 [Candidatus Woesearchaeota archaeon]|nr:hypothetical protein [Candidatus Woesearchaeota archaeon]
MAVAVVGLDDCCRGHRRHRRRRGVAEPEGELVSSLAGDGSPVAAAEAALEPRGGDFHEPTPPREESLPEERPPSPFAKLENEQRLTAFLQKVVDNDYPVEHFRDHLVAHGWTEEQIRYCLRYMVKK